MIKTSKDTCKKANALYNVQEGVHLNEMEGVATSNIYVFIREFFLKLIYKYFLSLNIYKKIKATIILKLIKYIDYICKSI